MKPFLYICALLLAFCGGILCTSCRSSKPQLNDINVGQLESLSPELVKSDELAEKPPRRLLGLLPPKKVVSSPENVASDKLSGSKLRKCKGCTIVYSAGPATVTTTTVGKKATAATGAGATATTIDKAKAPVTTGTGDATDQSGTGAASTIKGDGNAPVLTNAPVEAPDWKAQLAAGFATPVGKGLALLLLAVAGYGVYRLWPVLRRKSSDTQS